MIKRVIGALYGIFLEEPLDRLHNWYKNDSPLMRAVFQGQEVGKTYDCELWKSEKGNWLLTHEEDFQRTYGEAIEEEEAKALLMRYATETYESMFGELPEA